MLDSNIKKPMLIGILLYVISYLIIVVMTVTQYYGTGIFVPNDIEKSLGIIPMQIYTSLIHLLMLIVFYLIMSTYKGESRRVVEVIMFIVYVIMNAITGVAGGYLGSIFSGRKGQDYLIAYSGMSSAIQIFTSPFNAVAAILVVVAIGRYGVSKRNNQIPFQGGAGGFNNEYMA